MTKQDVAVVLVNPYNDFLHTDGKLNSTIRDSLEKTDTISNLQKMLDVARKQNIPIFYCLHQQCNENAMQGWTTMNSSLAGIKARKMFEEASWGVELYAGMEPDAANGDVVASKHWNSSSFHNTDLDYQLRQHGIRHLVMAGLVVNTCLESTARYAHEHGYTLTMLSDCTAGFSHAAKEAASSLIWPLFANEVVTVEEWVAGLDENIDGSIE